VYFHVTDVFVVTVVMNLDHVEAELICDDYVFIQARSHSEL
jgi:hypothetical protein